MNDEQLHIFYSKVKANPSFRRDAVLYAESCGVMSWDALMQCERLGWLETYTLPGEFGHTRVRCIK